MKTHRHLSWFLLLLLCLLNGSCVQDIQNQNLNLNLDNLTPSGQRFIDVVSSDPDWMHYWQEIAQAGTPLPNLAVQAYGGGYGLHYVMPVVTPDKKIVRLIYYTLTGKPQTDSEYEVAAPIIMDRERMCSDVAVKLFVEMPPFEKWKSEGLQLDLEFDIKPQECDLRTRSTGTEIHFPAYVLIVHFDNYDNRYEGRVSMPLIQQIFRGECSRVSGAGITASVHFDIVRDIACLDIVDHLDYSNDKWYEYETLAKMYFDYVADEFKKDYCFTHYMFKWGQPQEGGGSTGGGGSGGGSQTPESTPPFPNAKYVKPGLPNKINEQINDKYCAIAIVEFLRSYYGLGTLTQDQIAGNYYVWKYPNTKTGPLGRPTRMFGIPTSDVAPFIGTTFAISQQIAIYEALNKGYFVMTDKPTLAPSMSHSILIIGEEDNTLIYYDPADGCQKKIGIDSLECSFIITILGKK